MRSDLRPELACRERRRHYGRAAGVQGRQRRAEQPMHVKQRHHDQAGILGRQAVSLGDVADRRHQVGVRQRDPLGPAGRAAGVQEQGHILGPWRTRRGAGRFTVPLRHALQADAAAWVEAGLPNRQVQLRGGVARRVRARRQDHGPCLGVLHVKLELIGFVGGIQRGRHGPGVAQRQKADDEFQAVHQHDRNGRLRLDAAERQHVGQPGNFARQLGAADGQLGLGQDHGRAT